MFLSTRNHVSYLWFVDQTGRKQKISTHTSRKAEALVFLRTFDEQQSEFRKQRLTVSAFLQELFEHIRSNLSTGTHNIYVTAFADFVKLVGDMHLDKLTPYHWDKCKIERAKQVLPATVNIELRCLRAGLNTAVRWRRLPIYPLAGLPPPRVPQKQPAYFGRNDFVLLLQSIREDWLRNITLLAGVTGMRQGELLHLRWDHMDFEHHLVLRHKPTR